jgi:hypothetical protein
MYAIRNKLTRRYLIVEAEIDGGGWDSSTFLSLRDTEFADVVFVTNNKELAELLVKEGRSDYPQIHIYFGFGKTKFLPTDLEVVKLK